MCALKVDDILLSNMFEVAVSELRQCDRPSAAGIAKRLVRCILHEGELRRDLIFWPKGFLALGIEEFAGFSSEGASGPGSLAGSADESEKAISVLYEFYGPWIGRGCPVMNVDDCIAGSTMIYLYRRTGDSTLLRGVESIYEFLAGCKRDGFGALTYQASSKALADGIGQAAFFLYDYAALTGSDRALRFGEEQVRIFLKNAMDSGNGLCYHAYQVVDGGVDKLGAVGWGRAVGWLLLGMCRYESLREESDNLLRRACSFQRGDGLFSWQLCGEEGPADTSATSMIAYSSLVSGLGERRCLEGMVAGILSKVSDDGRVQAVHAECKGLGMYPQRFAHLPFGQGIALAAVSLACRKGLVVPQAKGVS